MVKSVSILNGTNYYFSEISKNLKHVTYHQNQPVEPEVTEEDIKVTHKQNTDFDYTSEVDSFPSPWGLWYWLGDEQGAVKQFEKVTGENNQFSLTKNISYRSVMKNI